jgi:hypothetical protein
MVRHAGCLLLVPAQMFESNNIACLLDCLYILSLLRVTVRSARDRAAATTCHLYQTRWRQQLRGWLMAHPTSLEGFHQTGLSLIVCCTYATALRLLILLHVSLSFPRPGLLPGGAARSEHYGGVKSYLTIAWLG